MLAVTRAGFLTVTEPYGPGSKRVSLTVDGRDALHLWRVYRPAPAEKTPSMDREPLASLLGGELASYRRRVADEEGKRRAVEREALFAALAELRAWEERTERAWDAWARVQGIRHRLGRMAPAGWVPTGEEIAEHRLDPDVVAELRAAAVRPTPRPQLPEPVRPAPKSPPPPPTLAPAPVEQLGLFDAA
ncbi:hypothetical protein ACH4Q7_22635 [Streptomyces roseolus]|uniref:hypothetical protein n=1 Tax=Streptomyces roseolus TaxID=67358 RepID=UPI00379E6762